MLRFCVFPCKCMEQNNATKLAIQISTDKDTTRMTWKALRSRFTELNDDRDNPNQTEYALIDFDYAQMPNPDYRLSNQRYWVISSNGKVFQSWAGGYSLFAYCLGDKNTDRMERIFNNNNVNCAYLITKEQRDKLHE